MPFTQLTRRMWIKAYRLRRVVQPLADLKIRDSDVSALGTARNGSFTTTIKMQPRTIDIIGDIHGHAVELKRLLALLGYVPHGRGYRHADRKVVFVGDFVDGGPAIGEVIEIVRTMVDAGDAFAVMGNHEYNAIAFHTARPDVRDEWFRRRSDKNLKQHHETLRQLSTA